MIIPIACDHAGFELKTKIIVFLEKKGYKIKDFGCHSDASIDYADYAHPLATLIEENKQMKGILLCGSGNGINMTANKHQGIRSALCWTSEIVYTFFSTDFEGGRHQLRIEKIPCN